MPLIIIVGKPCTGKTKIATALVDFLRNEAQKNVSESDPDVAKAWKVELIKEESLSILKKDGYASSANEKETRGCLKSATEHNLGKDSFVIVDSLNYIKGYRYELYCAARTSRIPHCVLWVTAPQSCSDQWNQQRIDEGKDAYSMETMYELRMRFEPPNDSNRWDSPLFKVFNGSSEVNGGGKGIDSARTAVQSPSTQARNESLKDDSNTVKNVPAAATETVTSKSSWRPVKKATKKKTIPDSTLDTASVFYGTNEQAVNSASNTSATVGSQSIAPQSEALSFSGTTAAACDVDLTDTQIDRNVVFTEIWNYFEGASVPVPNSSTIAVQRGAADILHELDRISQQVVLSLLAHQQSDSSSIVEGTPLKFPEFDRALALHRPVGLAELQRFRRQYVKINSQHPPANAKAVGASFIDFLSTQL